MSFLSDTLVFEILIRLPYYHQLVKCSAVKSILTFTILRANLVHTNLLYFPIFLSQKNKLWHFMHSPLETICMKCRSLFSGITNKNFLNWCLLKILLSVLSIKKQMCVVFFFFKKGGLNAKLNEYILICYNDNTLPLSCGGQITLLKNGQNLPVSNPKPDLHNIYAHTKLVKIDWYLLKLL